MQSFYLCLCSIRLHYRKDKKKSLKAPFVSLQARSNSAPPPLPPPNFYKPCLNLACVRSSLNPHLATLVLMWLSHNLSTQSTASAQRTDERTRGWAEAQIPLWFSSSTGRYRVLPWHAKISRYLTGRLSRCTQYLLFTNCILTPNLAECSFAVDGWMTKSKTTADTIY